MNSSTLSDMKAFIVFPFRDVDWKRKLGITALVGLTMLFIPILPLVLLAGYCTRLAQSVLDDSDGGLPRLPEWDEPVEMFKDGLRVGGAILTLILPLVLLALVLYAIVIAPMTAMSDSLQKGELAAILAVVFGSCISIFVILAALALGLVMPAAIMHVIAKHSYRAVFDVKDWLAIWRANLGGFLLSYAVVMALSLGMSLALTLLSVTIVLLCLTPFLIGAITAYIAIVQSALAAREYRIGRQRVWERLGVVAPAARVAPKEESPHPTLSQRARVAETPEPAAAAAEVIATAVYDRGAIAAQAAKLTPPEAAAAAVATVMMDRAELKEALAEPAREAAPGVENLPVIEAEAEMVATEEESPHPTLSQGARGAETVEPPAEEESGATVIYKREDLLGKIPPKKNE